MHATTTTPARDRKADELDARAYLDEQATALTDRLAALDPGDPARPRLRDEVIAAWVPMARRLARRYGGRGEAMDDLNQAATIGLIKAVDRFDASLGIAFPGYAVPTIVGELKRHFRDRAWAIRVPRRLQELRMAISHAGHTLSHTLGRSPTIADIAAHLGVSEEEVIEGLEGGSAYSTTSLSTPVGPDGSMELGDSLGSVDEDYARTELRLSVGPAMEHLTERERLIVTLRFYGNQTQTQIAERIGVSQMHVSRLLARALAKLRTQLGPDA